MVTYAQLRGIEPGQFQEAADGWQKVSSCASEAKDRLNDEITAKLRAALSGDGVNQAIGRLQRLSRNFHYVQVESGLVRTALDGLAAELRSAQRKLNTAVQEAVDAGMTVKDDGTVQGQEGAKQETVQGFADRIGDALREAGEADGRYAATLRELITDADLEVTREDWADVARDTGKVGDTAARDLGLGEVPKGKSPQENADWWKSLTDEQRADYVALYPASVGALDGIPSDVRDEANRASFESTRAKYQTELAGIPPEPPRPAKLGDGTEEEKRWTDWWDQYGLRKEHLEKALNGMGAIQDRFDATGKDGLPQAYLLGFDAEGDGRAIVANGNPDMAEHTSVSVPGTNTALGGAQRPLQDGAELWRSSNALSGGRPVSTVTWIGYDTPPDIPSATVDSYAEEGAPALNRFLTGLETAQGGPEASHTTVVAHSYGTVLVGQASMQGDFPADDLITVGSPGMNIESAEELETGKDHTWNQEAEGDAIPNWGRYVHGEGWGWTIPSDDDFGAHQMRTDTEGHGNYWSPRSESITNQARVITGRYGDVTGA
ncbi:alpha/beta hydrolase [Streptomyces daliensis]|uniref:DUF1023 domain-containing protein n=1 Tax=Streptomyces daliensis TaxID=299421 RepID=A0A8T4IUP0_9ACTN|nr:hypothetical protein [Streptomyces daliensis]